MLHRPTSYFSRLRHGRQGIRLAKVSGIDTTDPQYDVKKAVHATKAVEEGLDACSDWVGDLCLNENRNVGSVPQSTDQDSTMMSLLPKNENNTNGTNSVLRDQDFVEGTLENVKSREKTYGASQSGFTRLIKAVQRCLRTLVTMLDFSQFKNPLFVLLLGFIFFGNFVNSVLDYLSALVQQKGVSESQAALLLGIYGGLDLVCRVSCAVIARTNKVRMTTLTMVTLPIVAVLVQFVRFMTTFEHFLVLVVVHGLLGGVGNCMYPLLVIEFVGLDSMAKCFGWNQLAHGACMAVFYPLLGKLVSCHEIWGRYHGGRRPSSDDSFHSPTVIPPSAVDKPSIMKRRRTTR